MTLELQLKETVPTPYFLDYLKGLVNAEWLGSTLWVNKECWTSKVCVTGLGEGTITVEFLCSSDFLQEIASHFSRK